MILKAVLLSTCLGGLVFSPALAKVGEDQAKQLGGPTLTEFGAERAGNADGSIPAYTGGLTAANAPAPAGKDAAHAPDPYSSDKVLYVVSASNLSQYQNELTAGTAAMLRKYPDFHLNVYPTHRSMAYPQFVLDNTRKNATSAELVGSSPGDGVRGAYGGVPFPIPQNGYEVLWNEYLHWAGVSYSAPNGEGYLLDQSGHVTLVNKTNTTASYPYYKPNAASVPDGYYEKLYVYDTAPAAIDGSADIIEYPMNYSSSDQLIYFYTLGTRRVRLAPEFKYDTPISTDGGALLYDEIDLFIGRPDRFDFKLVGKKEMLIGYNNYKFNRSDVHSSDIMKAHYPNPDLLRFEKHRVWVVEATLKPGKRHIYSRRTMYFDEDSWLLTATDSYDAAGQLYRVAMKFPFPVYGSTYPTQYSENYFFANLNSGSYTWQNWFGGNNGGRVLFSDHLADDSLFQPERMASSGIR